jgi:hypothetical protein
MVHSFYNHKIIYLITILEFSNVTIYHIIRYSIYFCLKFIIYEV